ncbi:MAG: 30S ribosomal protein S6 [Bdellovibrionota bacterium]
MSDVLREYEFTFITNPHLNDQDTEKLLSKYEKILLEGGGQVIKKDNWGTKKLAFGMKGHYRGVYTHLDYVGKSENLAEAERLMRIDDDVLRYLSIRLGENVDVEVRKAEIAKAEAKAAAAKKEGALAQN